MRRAALALGLLLGCNPDPGEADQQVGFRVDAEEGASNGERGTIKISEILWSGSVLEDGTRDPADVFIELRNESNRPVNLSGWRIEQEGAFSRTYVLPETDEKLGVDEHFFIAAKDTGCFPSPDLVMAELELPADGDPIELTLRDVDERLIEPVGSEEGPPFAGGYDLVRSRSMERVQLMFGGQGREPASWHYYTPAEVDVPNNDRIAAECRAFTLASPGRPNSPDYSGAYSTGSFE
ncbi:MAG: lamin tail domain-containing protein [Alphaproteobacteria bacterium]|nr:lamin tail domain-containing protein [Alphaproteobacteria bacterium]